MLLSVPPKVKLDSSVNLGWNEGTVSLAVKALNTTAADCINRQTQGEAADGDRRADHRLGRRGDPRYGAVPAVGDTDLAAVGGDRHANRLVASPCALTARLNSRA
jgi:hypothetical protein